MIDKTCSKCGCTWVQFTRTGLFGCSNCYDEFARELMPTLKKIQRDYVHTGGSPKIKGADKLLFDEYKRLLSEKELAGINGDFPSMARITEELTELIDELKNRGIL